MYALKPTEPERKGKALPKLWEIGSALTELEGIISDILDAEDLTEAQKDVRPPPQLRGDEDELPDLAERIQVALLNVLEERDIQVRGYTLRLPLDLLVMASANPEDYTNRGRIITPMKDRFGAEITTHYPYDVQHEIGLIAQEADLVAIVPLHLLEAIALKFGGGMERYAMDLVDGLRAPLSVGDFIRALQFPESPDDKDGFRALRMALEDRNVAKLIRAAQDVLTLLAQEGIYMDDLKPDRARPELWRRFVAGERGGQISGLGGVRDRSSLALTAGRMRQDPVFRDAAHHFLRQFDKTFSEFESNASDQEVAELAETRTARAFMLLGRVTGTFD